MEKTSSNRCIHLTNSIGEFMPVQLTRRIDFPQVDLAGIVYYPQYWDLCHRFFEESWPKIAEIDYPALIKNRRLGFPAVSNNCTFHAPLRYGDTVTCKIWISSVGNTSVEWNYRYYNQNQELVWSAEVVTVCVDMDSLKPATIPEDLKAGLSQCKED